MANVGKINEATRSHVALVHHMSAGGTKLRGSTSIYAALDSSIYVTRNDETKIRTVKLGKQKDDESDLSFQFELMSVEIGRDASDKPVDVVRLSPRWPEGSDPARGGGQRPLSLRQRGHVHAGLFRRGEAVWGRLSRLRWTFLPRSAPSFPTTT